MRPPPPPKQQNSVREPSPPTAKDDPALKTLRRDWREICEDCAHVAPAARGYLRDTYPQAIENDMLSVGVDSEFYDEEQGNTEIMRFKDDLQSVVSQRLARDIGIKFTPVARIPKEDRCSDPDKSGGEDGGKTPREWCQEPIVKEAMELFDGDISELRI